MISFADEKIKKEFEYYLASIINDYAASAEEYLTAFSLNSEVHEFPMNYPISQKL